jgi:hypothetical protein
LDLAKSILERAGGRLGAAVATLARGSRG